MTNISSLAKTILTTKHTTDALTALLKHHLAEAWDAGFAAAQQGKNPYKGKNEVKFIFGCDGAITLQANGNFQKSYQFGNLKMAALLTKAIISDEYHPEQWTDNEAKDRWFIPTNQDLLSGVFKVLSLEELLGAKSHDWRNIIMLHEELVKQGVY